MYKHHPKQGASAEGHCPDSKTTLHEKRKKEVTARVTAKKQVCTVRIPRVPRQTPTSYLELVYSKIPAAFKFKLVGVVEWYTTE